MNKILLVHGRSSLTLYYVELLIFHSCRWEHSYPYTYGIFGTNWPKPEKEP